MKSAQDVLSRKSEGRPVGEDRLGQEHWIPGAATLPPRSPGCGNMRALGLAGLVAARRRGLGQGSLVEPERRMAAIGRESGTDGKRRRYSLTGTALRARLLWAEHGLGHKIPPGSRVLKAACGTGTVSDSPCSQQAAVRSVWHEEQHQLATVRSRGHGAQRPDSSDRMSEAGSS
jgi:hypothetical protein